MDNPFDHEPPPPPAPLRREGRLTAEQLRRVTGGINPQPLPPCHVPD